MLGTNGKSLQLRYSRALRLDHLLVEAQGGGTMPIVAQRQSPVLTSMLSPRPSGRIRRPEVRPALLMIGSLIADTRIFPDRSRVRRAVLVVLRLQRHLNFPPIRRCRPFLPYRLRFIFNLLRPTMTRTPHVRCLRFPKRPRQMRPQPCSRSSQMIHLLPVRARHRIASQNHARRLPMHLWHLIYSKAKMSPMSPLSSAQNLPDTHAPGRACQPGI